MTRDEQILALALMIEQLKAEQRIDNWMRANPGAVCWSMSDVGGRVFTVIRDGKVLAHSRGTSDDDARAQAFNAVLTNEAAAINE